MLAFVEGLGKERGILSFPPKSVIEESSDETAETIQNKHADCGLPMGHQVRYYTMILIASE